jgi:hypothetical protein
MTVCFKEVRFFFCVFFVGGLCKVTRHCEMGVVSSLLLVQSMVKLHNNPLGLGVDVFEADGDSARVGECCRQQNASGC